MTSRAQKQQDSYSYSTEGSVWRGGARTGATEEAGQQLRAQLQYRTDHPSANYNPAAQCARRGGEQQHLVSVSMKSGFVNVLAEVWKIGGFARVLSAVGACCAGISNPLRIRIRPLLTVGSVLWSGGCYAGSTAAVTVSPREWWMYGMGFLGGMVVCWLWAGVVVTLGHLKKLLDSKPPGVINVTPPGKREKCELNPYFSVCEPDRPCNCDRMGLPEPAVLVEQPCECFNCWYVRKHGLLKRHKLSCLASKAGGFFGAPVFPQKYPDTIQPCECTHCATVRSLGGTPNPMRCASASKAGAQ